MRYVSLVGLLSSKWPLFPVAKTTEIRTRIAATRLQDRFLFGSDYPFITPQRWLKDFDALTYFKPEVREKLLWKNGQKLLAHTAVGKMEFSD